MASFQSSIKLIFIALLALTLSACLTDDPVGAAGGSHIEFTNPAGTSTIQTPDIVINLSGKVTSDVGIESVTWVNDRGGSGKANGKEQWSTGNIVLQTGTNTITITATDVNGGTSSKSISVERENTTATDSGPSSADPIAMYSYSSNLSNAAPVSGSTISAKIVYFFILPGDKWQARSISEIRIRCCEGISGPGTNIAHSPVTTSASAQPWSVSVNLSQFQTGGIRRIGAYAVYTDGSSSSRPFWDFTIGNSTQSTGNSAPTISGNPSPDATVGIQYNFRPVGQDPDGDTMSFSIVNKPAWASFNGTTGRLFGTPGANDVGVYNSIIIRVSDGKTTSSSSAFSITVAAFGNGTATLQWAAPTQRTDNTSLTNLAGFNLYYGQTSGDYANKIAINTTGVSTYVVDNLSSGNWYFVITAVDRDNIESNPSNEVIRSF
jgi:hypothetical protein